MYLNSVQNILLGLSPLVHVTKNMNYFVIQCNKTGELLMLK